MNTTNSASELKARSDLKKNRAGSRQERIEELKEMISRGEYRVNSIELAQSVLKAVEGSPKN